MHWITELPPCGPLGFNDIFTIVNRTAQGIRLAPCVLGAGGISAEEIAKLFFDGIVRHYGLPDEVLHDRDPRFTADFWTALSKALGSKAVFSSAYHPQMDGRAKHMHCTIE